VCSSSPAGEWVKLAHRRGPGLERGRVPVEESEHQPPQWLVGDVRLRQALQLRPHRLDVVPGVLDKGRGVETVGAVVVMDGADVMDVNLRAVALVLAVVGAELVERALAPVELAGLEPRAIGPDHERDRSASVAETAGVIRLVFARRAPGAFRQQGEEVAGLTRRQLAQPHQGWLRPRHGSTIQALATKNTKNHEEKNRTGRQGPGWSRCLPSFCDFSCFSWPTSSSP
jgi:hypothetical protein